MNDHDELQEFDLDDILREFHQNPPEDVPEQPAEEDGKEEAPSEPPAQEPAGDREESSEELSEEELSRILEELPQEEAPQEEAPQEEVSQEKVPPEEAPREEPVSASQDTVRLDDLSEVPSAPQKEGPPKSTILELDPKARLRELKKKLIAGPEKRYYELSELGLGKLQTAVFLNLLIVLLCAGTTTLFAMDMVPQNRLRLVIFSQILAMLVSALMGSHQMLDGLGDLFKGRFTVNTLLTITFASCCVDAVYCLRDLRVPCCAAFSLEMAMALLARYHRRSTEMGQMDTLRKAVRLHAMVKVPDCYQGKPGILRGYGRVEDFMENYSKPSGPEKFQCVYAFVSLLLCAAIAVFAGLRHGSALAVQVFSTSLLVAVPASYFVALTRPAAILEKRLHMVGTVLCGWKGIKNLRGNAVFPLKDEDLFPQGSSKLNGVKFYGDRSPDEVVSYAASLICRAGGGLEHVFRQLLASRGGRELPVSNFRNYGGGGIGGEVCGEGVLLGSCGFLRDMGVEVPEGSMVSHAVYVAVDGEFCAVVAISYAKMRSSSAGLVSLCSSRRLTPVLVGGDFMITEEMLREKFGINTRRIVFPPQEVRAELKLRQPEEGAAAAALTTREDLTSFAYAVSGARALRLSAILGTVVHVLGGMMGMAIMLVLAYLGSVELLTPTNVLLYQLVWLIPGLLLTEWTRAV